MCKNIIVYLSGPNFLQGVVQLTLKLLKLLCAQLPQVIPEKIPEQFQFVTS